MEEIAMVEIPDMFINMLCNLEFHNKVAKIFKQKIHKNSHALNNRFAINAVMEDVQLQKNIMSGKQQNMAWLKVLKE